MADNEKNVNETTEEQKPIFVEDPAFDIEYKGDCAYEVKVTIPVANEASQAEELFDELKNEAEIPGFRRGRAPRALVEKRFAKVVKGEVETKLVSASFEKLVEDNKFKVIGSPDVDGVEELKDRKDDEPMAFTLKFEVAPRVELGKYRGLDIERPVITVTDKDVDEVIKSMLERQAAFEPLAKTGKAKKDDQVTMDFEGKVDGEAFEGGAATDYPYILGSNRFFPEFEEALSGAKAGDELTCEITFPDDYFNADLQGKKADFTINVKEIQRRKTPKLDDEFAKTVGADDVDALKANVRENLERQAEEEGRSVAEDRAMTAIIADSTYEIPKSLIDSTANTYFEQEMRRLMQMRVPMSEIENRTDEIRQNAENAAVSGIKRMVTLSEIGEAEGIEVTEEDFEQEAQSIVERTGAEMDLVNQFLAREDQRSSYEDRIYRTKAMAVIMDSATLTNKEMTRDEWAKEVEAENTADKSE